MCEEPKIHVADEKWKIKDFFRHIIQTNSSDRTFTVFDIKDLLDKYNNWERLMPRIQPFYAVKCNYNKMVMRILAALGAGFDCASIPEIDYALATGIPPDRIIFAHTAKPRSHIEHARRRGVDLLTFDSEFELHKIKQYHQKARLVMRIKNDALIATCPLGQKYGCCPYYEAPNLLKTAYKLGLKVVGVSFHVGSGCRDNGAHARGIAVAKRLFNLGKEIGHDMNILDIGGGFPGDEGTTIDQMANEINRSLDLHFPESDGVKIISEPGRYFVASAFTLACLVHSARRVYQPDGKIHTMYFMDNGVYASFAGIAVNRLIINPEPLDADESSLIECSLWGPTCDGIDVVVKSVFLPELLLPSWILFSSFGAYTSTTSTKFNGFGEPDEYAFATNTTMKSLLRLEYFSGNDRFTSETLPTDPPETMRGNVASSNVNHLYRSPMEKCQTSDWKQRTPNTTFNNRKIYENNKGGLLDYLSPNKIRTP